jgi:hypothetical protein
MFLATTFILFYLSLISLKINIVFTLFSLPYLAPPLPPHTHTVSSQWTPVLFWMGLGPPQFLKKNALGSVRRIQTEEKGWSGQASDQIKAEIDPLFGPGFNDTEWSPSRRAV